MNHLCFLTLILFIISNYDVQCAISLRKVNSVPDKPDYCAISKKSNTDETELKIGSEIPFKNGCGEIRCTRTRDDLYLTSVSCGAVPANCKIASDLTKPYPDCCDKCE